jgi:Zn-dependent peptidase ImmA (M78 family)
MPKPNLSKFRKNRFGLPILSAIDIENITIAIAQIYTPAVLKIPQGANLNRLMQKLEQEYGLTFDFSDDLGHDEKYRKRIGHYDHIFDIIYVDQAIEVESSVWCFTLAHEIGHFFLHKEWAIENEIQKDDPSLPDIPRDLFLDKVREHTAKNWREWQANRFAASYLMPEHTFRAAIMLHQETLGISRNLGEIYVDKQRRNYSDLLSIINFLREIFKTSRTAIRIRLRELDLVKYDERTAHHISSVLESIL